MFTVSLNKSDNKKQLLFLFVFTIIVMLLIPVFADGTRSTLDAIESMLSDIMMDSTSEVGNILSLMPKIASDGSLSSGSSTLYQDVWPLVKSIVEDVVTPMAYSILGLYFVTSIANMGMKYESLNMEMFLKPFISFLAACVCVNYTPTLISTFINIGSYFITRLHTVVSIQSAPQIGAVMDAIKLKATTFWTARVVHGQIMLPWLASKAIGFYMKLLAYSTVIEIFVRACLMPLSYGDLCFRGFDGGGFRYVKTFAAVCIRGGLMYLIAAIMGRFVSVTVGNIITPGDYMTMIGRMIVVNGAGAMMMSRADGLAREAVGV